MGVMRDMPMQRYVGDALIFLHSETATALRNCRLPRLWLDISVRLPDGRTAWIFLARSIGKLTMPHLGRSDQTR